MRDWLRLLCALVGLAVIAAMATDFNDFLKTHYLARHLEEIDTRQLPKKRPAPGTIEFELHLCRLIHNPRKSGACMRRARG